MNETRPRSNRPTDEGPWVWLSKQVLKVITDMANETNSAPSVRSVYLALTQLVRDGVPVVVVTRALICSMAGVRYTTLDAALKVLVRAGATSIERTRHNGLDTGLRITLLSVPDKREPVSVTDTDKYEEGGKNERGERIERTTAKAVRSLSGPMPLPKSVEEVQDYTRDACFDPELGTAFWNMMTAKGWIIRGRQVGNWKAALAAWCHADEKRTRNLKPDRISNAEFWAFVAANEITSEAANAYLEQVDKKGGKFLNRLTGRLEPVRDHKAALKAFVESDLNREFERMGSR